MVILRNILLVDDSRESQLLMNMAFQSADVACGLNFVENGDEALDFLKREGHYHDAPPIDLILLDLNLPGQHGIEVLKEIRREPKLVHIPVIVFTVSNASSDIRACSVFPRCRYVLKPSRFHELVGFVKSIKEFY